MLKPHFYKKCQQFRNFKIDVSLASANKPQSSLVLYPSASLKSIVTVELAVKLSGQI